MTITKSDLVARLSEATGWTKVDVEIILNGFMAGVMESIQDGDRVEIRGFGSFYSKERQPRMVKNPKTDTMIAVDHRFVPVFKPAKHFRESVNQELLSKNSMEQNES